MANKVKKISVNALEKAIKTVYVPTVTKEWNGLSIVIKKKLNLAETMLFIDSVVSSCIIGENGDYAPEIKSYAVRSLAIALYTNLRLPSDEDKIYDVLYGNGLWELVTANIAKDQFDDIMKAIDSKIEYLSYSNAAVVNQQAEELYSTIEELSQKIATLFDGVESDDVKNIVSSFANGGIDEEKLMQAYLGNKVVDMPAVDITEVTED